MGKKKKWSKLSRINYSYFVSNKYIKVVFLLLFLFIFLFQLCVLFFIF